MQLVENVAKFNLHVLNNCNHSWVKCFIAKFFCESLTPYCVEYIIQVSERTTTIANNIWVHFLKR